MRTVLTLAVDSYDSLGNLTGSVIAARASSTAVPPQDLVEQVVASLPPEWSQMTYDELVDHFAATRPGERHVWDQLSLF